MTKKSFPIVGMHCASCAKLIERSLSKVPGVSNASVNYGSESAMVEMKNDVEDKVLENAVKEAGYKAIVGKSKLSKEEEKLKELKSLKTKVIVSAILSFFVFIGSFPELFKFSLNPIIL